MKVAGLLLVMIFSCCMGKYFAEKEKKKVRLCSDICRLLEYFKHSVYTKQKVDDIIRRYCEGNKDGVISANSKSELIYLLKSIDFDEKIENALENIIIFLREFGRLQDSKKESERL